MTKQSKTRGILLLNLGSPDSPAVTDVRAYLAEFLMDKYVLDTHFLIRSLVVYGTILPNRPQESASAYEKIWTKEGSPLVFTTEKTAEKLAEKLAMPINYGMRYGSPGIRKSLESLWKQGKGQLSEILVLPLYPHYALSSTKTATEAVISAAKSLKINIPIKTLNPFFEDPYYVDALVETAKPFLSQPFDHLLFSYHGLPERHLRKADPTGEICLKKAGCCDLDTPAVGTCYKAQTVRTTQAFIQKSQVDRKKVSVAYQSRLGRDPWIQPFTDKILAELPKQGKKRLLVICPSFVADCLETLEEIEMRGRDIFLESGGESFDLIPCINTSDSWIKALQFWCLNPEKSFSPLI
ncbi:MAG: ferrochelatase [Candidatus Marinamargulisbacteria bacterium]|jgi:ferrochelatase